MPTLEEAVDELTGRPEPQAQSIAEALRTARRPLAGEEAARIEAIEARRRELAASDRLIPGYAELTVGDACSRASKAAGDAVVLFRLIRQLKPKRCLEMGTNLGISGAYQAAALALNGDGRLITLEGHPGRAEIAQETFDRLGQSDLVELRVGKFDRILDAALEAPVDYAFVDGDHREESTLEYFDAISATAAPRALVVFDDIQWSEGMKSAWERIRADERLEVSVGLERMGIGVLASP